MKLVKDNPLLQGLSGKFGNAVVRQTKKGIVVAPIPRRTDREPTEKQKAARKRFREAVLWAKGIKGDLRDVYIRIAAEKNCNPFNLIVSDHRHPPKIVELDASDYHGKKGQRIRVKVETLGRMQKVTVAIEDKTGKKLDQGEATAEDAKCEWWAWSATRTIPSQCVVLRIAAKDIPGHWVELEREREV